MGDSWVFTWQGPVPLAHPNLHTSPPLVRWDPCQPTARLTDFFDIADILATSHTFVVDKLSLRWSAVSPLAQWVT
jgi:hypothetical protein